jgi:hypothetical protein
MDINNKLNEVIDFIDANKNATLGDAKVALGGYIVAINDAKKVLMFGNGLAVAFKNNIAVAIHHNGNEIEL